MVKLFALEDDDILKNLESNDLLIDKVLKLTEKNKDPVSLTADVIKQRQELKTDIQERLNAEPKDDSKDDDSSSDDDSDKDKEDDDSSSDDDSDKDKEDEDLLSKADNKDSLKSLIGSATSNNKDDSDNKKPAQESYKLKLSLSNIFKPIKDKHNKYLISLEDFNVTDKVPINSHKVVYVKDAVLESLNNLITIANNYIGKNKTFIDSNTEAVKNINKRLTILRQFIKNKRYHFTHNLVNDQDLLSQVSVVNKSDISETIVLLIKYIDDSNKFVNYILNNDFNSVESALSNANFIKEDDDFIYKTMLPGFNMIRVHLDEYTNYLKINIENFQFYQLKTFKTEYLYDLDAISFSKENKLDLTIDKLDKLLIDLSMFIDNFNVVNANLTKLIDEIKVLVYDVEQNKHVNLAELNIDSKVKDFIKFKLVSEAYHSNVNMLLNYILNTDTIINKCIELKTTV